MMSGVLHYTEYESRLAAYAVIVDDRDRVLLALWNESDEPLWTLPGGGVELHETVEEGAVRELREETGYDVRLGRVLGVPTIVIPPEERTVPRGGWFRGSGWSSRRRSWAGSCATRWTAAPTRRAGSRWPTCPTCPASSWSTSGSGCGRPRSEPVPSAGQAEGTQVERTVATSARRIGLVR